MAGISGILIHAGDIRADGVQASRLGAAWLPEESLNGRCNKSGANRKSVNLELAL